MTHQLPQRFLVAFSLAGEQRKLVRAVAEEVERRLGDSTVFYDEWFEFYIAGDNADLKLKSIYRDRCELAVICISKSYGSRSWTTAEYAAVRARYMESASVELDRDRVLAVRVGDGEVEGIHLNYVVPDLRQKSLQEAAQLIIDRLRLVSPLSVKSQSERVEWRHHLPSFRWPLANHTEVQDAFRSFLLNGSPTRLLTIQGVSETGKTSLAKQMERNVSELLPEVRCGRFDFKGTIDRQIETDAFAQSLGVALSTGQGSSDQLSEVVSRLLDLPRPTLLIFDTYEDAGDAQMWIQRIFLPKLLRAEWLRVVVLGEHVPSPHDGIWESITALPMTLELPDAKAWLEYGRALRPDVGIDLDFVSRAHDLTHGRPSPLPVYSVRDTDENECLASHS